MGVTFLPIESAVKEDRALPYAANLALASLRMWNSVQSSQDLGVLPWYYQEEQEG